MIMVHGANDLFDPRIQLGGDLVDFCTQAAVPVLHLFDPTFRAIEAITHVGKAWTTLKTGITAYKCNNFKDLTKSVAKTVFAVTLATGFGFVQFFRYAFIAYVLADLVT